MECPVIDCHYVIWFYQNSSITSIVIVNNIFSYLMYIQHFSILLIVVLYSSHSLHFDLSHLS